jgi:FkbM family methyltransferase
MKASGCIVVMNDEQYIARAVHSLKQFDIIDEIVVVDGGSTDGTVAICEQLGCRVVVNPWPGDFSVQRNLAMNLCKNEWIITSDSDEWYPKNTCEILTRVLKNPPNKLACIRLLEITDLSSTNDDVPLTIEDINKHYDDSDIEKIKSTVAQICISDHRVATLSFSTRIINKNRGRWVNQLHETFEILPEYRNVYLPNEYLIQHQKTHQRQHISNARYSAMTYSDCVYSTNYDDFADNMSKKSVHVLDEIFFKLVTEIAPCDYFIEAGAWDGDTSRKVQNIRPTASVYAFEANPYNYNQFKPLFDNTTVNYLPMAVSNHNGQVTFKIHTDVNGIGLPQVKGNDSLLFRTESGVTYEEVTVQSTTLDTYFGDKIATGKSVSLWVDLEGAAYMALEGARKLLEKVDVIKIEVESHQFWENQKLDNDILLFLSHCGFFPLLRDYEYPQQYNIVFVKQPIMLSGKFAEFIKPYNLTRRELA